MSGMTNRQAEAFPATIPEDIAAPSRRQFLGGMGALTLAVGFGGGIAHATATQDSAAAAFAPNAFIRVDSAGQVTVLSRYLEMGQGTFTGLATMAAEELDVGLDKVRVEGAPVDTEKYFNPAFKELGWTMQGTGGSTAMGGSWADLRQAAATARAMLLSAAAKKWGVAPGELTVEDGVIVHAGSGRRAGYGVFANAAAHEPVPEKVPVKAPENFRLIGKADTRRVDVPPKVDGTAIYTQDVQLPGMLVAVVAHPPKMWAKVRRVDASRAKAIPGVVAVVEFPGDDDVQGGVAVLARNTWVAEQGRNALDIEWDDSSALKLGTEELREKFLKLADKAGLASVKRGKIWEDAPSGGKVIEGVYEQPYLAHASMEPLNCVVHLQGDRCEIWNGEQFHTADQNYAAQELGIKPEQVKINQLYAGGSFGRRASSLSDYVRQAVRIARSARDQGITVPVKMIWMREDDMRAGHFRPMTVHKVRAVLDGDGKLASWYQHVVGQGFMEKDAAGIDHVLVEGAEDIPYAIPNFRVEQTRVEDVKIHTQWMRSVGHTHSAFVGETMIEEVARAAGKDPYQFRCDMLPKGSRERGVLDLVAEKSGWRQPLRPGAPGERRGRGMALQKSFGTYVAHVAEVTIRADNSFSIDRIHCAVDCGAAINPNIIAQQMEGGAGFGLSFLKLAITLRDGEVVQGNFNDYPVLRMNAMPPVDVSIVPSREPPTGVGEPGVPPASPAVVNAIVAATGKAIRSLPLSDDIRFS